MEESMAYPVLSDHGYKVCATCGYLGSDRIAPLWKGDECESCADVGRRCYRCGSRNLWHETCLDCEVQDA